MCVYICISICVCARAGLPILVLAYSNQTSVMPVFRELKEEKRTQSGFVAVTGTTYALVFLVYATVGCAAVLVCVWMSVCARVRVDGCAMRLNAYVYSMDLFYCVSTR